MNTKYGIIKKLKKILDISSNRNYTIEVLLVNV